MGGIGSGRHWYAGAKDTTRNYRSIDVRRWKRGGLLTPGQSFGWQWSRQSELVASILVRSESDRVTLTYRHRSGGKDWKDGNYPVRLDQAACKLGGQRPWFLCPARGCGRRTALLYIGSILACRQCHQLAYASQKEAAYDRVARRADKIREKLGWEPGILNRGGGRPKGVHWETFKRLTLRHDSSVEISLAAIEARLNIFKRISNNKIIK